MGPPTTRCVILGGGGHALVLIDAIQAGNAATPVAVLDADATRWGTVMLGVPIRGGDELLHTLEDEGTTHFAVGLGSIARPKPRERVFLLGQGAGLTPLTVVHPRATCSPHAALGAGCQLFAGCVVNPGASLGTNVIINTGAIVEHDCEVGDHAHVATGARLGGAVRVGEGAHIGAGATILEGRSVGRLAVVGAGAVVVHDVPPETVVAGVPARVLRTTAAPGGQSSR